MKLRELLDEAILREEDEAPVENDNTDDFDFGDDNGSESDNTDMNNTDDNNGNDNGTENDSSDTQDDNGDKTDTTNDLGNLTATNDDDIDSHKAVDPSSEIEQMVGIVDIQHSSSSTFIDFEDGGQVMFVQPITTLKVETIKQIIELIKKDVKDAYAQQTDEVTGRKLKDVKYWKSISVIIDTMVESQMTKSDNLNGLIEEVRQLFKILDIK